MNALEHCQRDLRLSEMGLRPEDAPPLRQRLAELRREYWQQWKQGLDADTTREVQYKPKPRSESCLRPMGYDQYLDSHGVVREQDCDVRPDL